MPQRLFVFRIATKAGDALRRADAIFIGSGRDIEIQRLFLIAQQNFVGRRVCTPGCDCGQFGINGFFRFAEHRRANTPVCVDNTVAGARTDMLGAPNGSKRPEISDPVLR